jgi:PatG C-terminal/Subtilase family/PatG Domain
VAILDGPVDLAHPCFAGANLARLDTLASAAIDAGPASSHGTHVASLIFGQPGSSVVGLAPRCRGLIAPIFRDGAERFVSQIDLARAIEQAVAAGAQVINISGGERSPDGQPDGTLRRALELCEGSDVLVVAAVGNDGCSCLHVPAAVPSVLGVGALGVDGEPLWTSNWGPAYRSNAILAPGENIRGAAPWGGTASLTGSSFAAPLVSGVAALLLSAQASQGRAIDPRAAGQALLRSALRCQPPDSPECRRYLVGVLNVPGAYAFVEKEGRTLMASDSSTEAPHPAEGTLAAETGAGGPGTAGRPQAAMAGVTMAGGVSPAACSCQGGASDAAPRGVAVAGDCGCGGGAGATSYVFAIGEIGFDFGTEARRDSFRQLMPRWSVGGDRQPPGGGGQAPGDAYPVEGGGEGSSPPPPVTIAPNPYDPVQLVDYLDNNKADSTKLIWTLNLDLTPIYAVEAEPAYAEEVYQVLRSALRNQSLPSTDPNYVSRVSIPGVMTGRTRRLFSGQVVPVVTAQARGLYTWNENELVQAIVSAVGGGFAAQQVQQTIRNYLDKIYYQLRNLGQSSPDRALNYAATNAFIFAEGVAQGLMSSTNLPGGQNLYTLDTISVSKSPYCRIDSDCWDVQVTFFDPENDRRARSVYLYTIDVSDEMPVSLAPTHQFFTAS